MQTKIYQINSERDKKSIKFFGLEEIEKLTGTTEIDPALYDEVFNYDIEETEPERIHSRFNSVYHPLFRGHSLSVTDVIVNENGAFFCDSSEYRKIDFDESKTQKPDNLMRIIYVEPHKVPHIAEVAHNFKALQRAVCGSIETISNGDGTCISYNQMAKENGMEGNRRIGDGSSIIAGPFFICGETESAIRSLSDEEVVRYMDRFKEPEDISDDEVREDVGITFIPM